LIPNTIIIGCAGILLRVPTHCVILRSENPRQSPSLLPVLIHNSATPLQGLNYLIRGGTPFGHAPFGKARVVRMKVQDVMTRDVKFCGPDTNLAVAAEIMRRNNYDALLVLDSSGRVLGLVTGRDMFIALGTRNWRAGDFAVRHLALTNVMTCGPNDDVHEALRIMRKQRVARVPVVDENGKLAGIVSLDDLVLHAEKDMRKSSAGISYDDIVNTMKAIREHRGSASKPTARQ